MGLKPALAAAGPVVAATSHGGAREKSGIIEQSYVGPENFIVKWIHPWLYWYVSKALFYRTDAATIFSPLFVISNSVITWSKVAS